MYVEYNVVIYFHNVRLLVLVTTVCWCLQVTFYLRRLLWRWRIAQPLLARAGGNTQQKGGDQMEDGEFEEAFYVLFCLCSLKLPVVISTDDTISVYLGSHTQNRIVLVRISRS